MKVGDKAVTVGAGFNAPIGTKGTVVAISADMGPYEPMYRVRPDIPDMADRWFYADEIKPTK